jgi:hypothetical protein
MSNETAYKLKLLVNKLAAERMERTAQKCKAKATRLESTAQEWAEHIRLYGAKTQWQRVPAILRVEVRRLLAQ